MGATLNIADQKRAYTLTDRGTYLSLQKRLGLVIVFRETRHSATCPTFYAVNPEDHAKARHADARAFIEFLVSPSVQESIGAFKRDVYGESLFFPDGLGR